MDEQNLTPKNDRLSGFFQHPIRTNPFGSNKSGDRMYQRAERICAALHLLTNHIPAQEPVRALVRTHSLKLLEYVIASRDEMRSPESTKFTAIRSAIRTLVTEVRVLTVSGFVSLQNADVIIGALDELGTLLGTLQRSPLSESIVLTRDDFTVVREELVQRSPRPFIKDIRDSSIVKDSDSSITLSEMSLRKKNILQILRMGGQLGIRDIALQAPEYSEKMIQRELADLIEAGLVKKTGLKRWSRYSLTHKE